MAHVEWNGNVGSAEVQAATDEVLAKIAAEVAADAQRLAPVDTGLLRSSIDSELTGPGHAKVHAHAPYAFWVEAGTSRMRARPFLRPALFRARGK